MELSSLLLVVLAVAAGVAEGGLLRVPRVYNALISTNQRLAPSRADPVSIPVPVVGVAAPLALVPTLLVEDPEAASSSNSSSAAPDAKPEEAEAPAPSASSNDTTATAHVFPLALYGAYGYYPYSYHYHAAAPFLLPPPLLHPYSYGVLPLLHTPLAVAHAKPPAEGNPKAEKVEDDAKESVAVEASR